MNYWILLRSFFIGILASSSLGPIFVLTFNRGAIHGFLRGFTTALGAAMADSTYFFLGLIGVLTLLQDSRHLMIVLDAIAGILLLLLGIYSIRKIRKNKACCKDEGGKPNVFATMGKSFLLTILNPLVILFFMVISAQVLPEDVIALNLKDIFLCSIMVFGGSLFVLSIVSLVASILHHCISQRGLKMISYLSSFVFICGGCYFLVLLFIDVVKFIRI